MQKISGKYLKINKFIIDNPNSKFITILLNNNKKVKGWVKNTNNLSCGVKLYGKNNKVAFIPSSSILMIVYSD